MTLTAVWASVQHHRQRHLHGSAASSRPQLTHYGASRPVAALLLRVQEALSAALPSGSASLVAALHLLERVDNQHELISSGEVLQLLLTAVHDLTAERATGRSISTSGQPAPSGSLNPAACPFPAPASPPVGPPSGRQTAPLAALSSGVSASAFFATLSRLMPLSTEQLTSAPQPASSLSRASSCALPPRRAQLPSELPASPAPLPAASVSSCSFSMAAPLPPLLAATASATPSAAVAFCSFSLASARSPAPPPPASVSIAFCGLTASPGPGSLPSSAVPSGAFGAPRRTRGRRGRRRRGPHSRAAAWVHPALVGLPPQLQRYLMDQVERQTGMGELHILLSNKVDDFIDGFTPA